VCECVCECVCGGEHDLINFNPRVPPQAAPATPGRVRSARLSARLDVLARMPKLVSHQGSGRVAVPPRAGRVQLQGGGLRTFMYALNAGNVQ